MSQFHVAVDIGGTFTDIVVQDTVAGGLWTAKTPTTPSDLAEGFMIGVRLGLSRAEAEPGDVTRMFHGATIATNAVIERRPANIGLLTTRGFKYLLEMGGMTSLEGITFTRGSSLSVQSRQIAYSKFPRDSIEAATCLPR